MIDAHQHCWQLARPEFAWPTPQLPALYRDFGPDDWRALAEPLGVRRSVLVQSQPDDRDTDFLLSLAEAHPHIAAVVGWVDLASPAAPARIRELAAHPKLRGLRPMLQNNESADWILRPELAPALETMVETGLSFDALVTPEHLPALLSLVERHPQLPVVIDHAAKPDIAGGGLAPWRAAMAPLADYSQVSCKLSGLLTEAAPGQGRADLQPYVDCLWDWFGAERLMWGSDWPVLNLAGDYAQWLAMSRDLLAGISDEQWRQVSSATAHRIYRVTD